MGDVGKVKFGLGGKGGGDIFQKLLDNNFDVRVLRTNDTLLYDEWKAFDDVVLPAAQERLIGVGDLQSRGLTYTIPNGMGKTALMYQDASGIEDAEINMDGITKAQRDRPEYDAIYLPLPIIHCDFWFSAREIQVSRSGGMPLDTTMAGLSARQVAEKVEEILFIGAGAYTFGGGTIRGYMDAPQRNTGSMTVDWATATGAQIITDVRAMKQASIDALHYGPWILYIPTAYETALDEDFKAASDKTIRQRILEISGIEAVKVADKLTAANVLLVQMTSDVVRIVDGLPITTVQWDSEGGMKVNFKVMTILVPQIRNDQNNNSGVTHWT